MRAGEDILSVWRRFDGLPMDNLVKVWHSERAGVNKQRSVEEMREHRDVYGLGGNYFDLALWLLTEFRAAGIEAYPIGSKLGTEEAHAAVLAIDENGRRFLCDLGDQWIQPILVETQDAAFSDAPQTGFFPGAEVQLSPEADGMTIIYQRPGGKLSVQKYSLQPIDLSEFWQAAEYSQHQLGKTPLIEVRVPYEGEVAHWEFNDWQSELSTMNGLINEEPAPSLDAWIERIHARSGYDRGIVEFALAFYKSLE
ncbi:hypothetical protein [Planococcus sp. ISL-109]|uniref:hypothetical protein n=1 Tax=Planococcus sp. ISL-109 TaxID=2819166 RepID=UPI001BEABBE3|nr:hypothetical protein [Planococcus sp. ISL-109]MBT2581526.1 hypothetical protein [Planococcus sp. ISL-109]